MIDRLIVLVSLYALYLAKFFLQNGNPSRAVKLLARVANAGAPEAMHELGRFYLLGQGVVSDKRQAGRWFYRAAQAGYLPSQCIVARYYLFGLAIAPWNATSISLFDESRSVVVDWEKAAFWARSAATAGSSEGQTLLGHIFSSGPENMRDEEQAEALYMAAAAAGEVHAKLELGLMRLRRADTADRTVSAVGLVREAAEAGLPTAHYFLAGVYERGVGVRADPVRAIEHYAISAIAGVRDAQTKYGILLLKGYGTKVNRVAGETWLRRAALAGDDDAALLVGDLYAEKGTIPPNYVEAEIWYHRAYEVGHRVATRKLSILYRYGIGVSIDVRLANRLLRSAAQAGDSIAQADMAALVLKDGAGDELLEMDQIFELFECSAREGDPNGAYNSAVCLARGLGVTRDKKRAAQRMRKAAEAIIPAQLLYAQMLFHGWGVPQDYSQAMVWLIKAAEHNSIGAILLLAEMVIKDVGCARDHPEIGKLLDRAANADQPDVLLALRAMQGRHASSRK